MNACWPTPSPHLRVLFRLDLRALLHMPRSAPRQLLRGCLPGQALCAAALSQKGVLQGGVLYQVEVRLSQSGLNVCHNLSLVLYRDRWRACSTHKNPFCLTSRKPAHCSLC